MRKKLKGCQCVITFMDGYKHYMSIAAQDTRLFEMEYYRNYIIRVEGSVIFYPASSILSIKFSQLKPDTINY